MHCGMAGSSVKYVVVGAIVAILALIIGLVASSLKKLATDEGKSNNYKGHNYVNHVMGKFF